jgi:hypothetical protein
MQTTFLFRFNVQNFGLKYLFQLVKDALFSSVIGRHLFSVFKLNFLEFHSDSKTKSALKQINSLNAIFHPLSSSLFANFCLLNRRLCSTLDGTSGAVRLASF